MHFLITDVCYYFKSTIRKLVFTILYLCELPRLNCGKLPTSHVWPSIKEEKQNLFINWAGSINYKTAFHLFEDKKMASKHKVSSANELIMQQILLPKNMRRRSSFVPRFSLAFQVDESCAFPKTILYAHGQRFGLDKMFPHECDCKLYWWLLSHGRSVKRGKRDLDWYARET